MSEFALLGCEDASKWQGYEQCYVASYGAAATWDLFKCYESELPALEQATRYRGIVVSGSHYSAYEDRPWIHALKAWIKDFVQLDTNTRLIGICFGTQALAYALGGTVGPNPFKSFVLTVEDVQLGKALRAKPYFRQAVMSSGRCCQAVTSVKLLESHGDQILEPPEGAETLAASKTAKHEIWVLHDRIMGIQGHPEFTCFDFLHKIHPYLTRNGRLSPEESAASEQSMLHNSPDNDFVNTLIRAFMAPGPTPGASTPLPLQLPAASAAQPSTEASAGFPAPAPALQAETSAVVAQRVQHAPPSAAVQQEPAQLSETSRKPASTPVSHPLATHEELAPQASHTSRAESDDAGPSHARDTHAQPAAADATSLQSDADRQPQQPGRLQQVSFDKAEQTGHQAFASGLLPHSGPPRHGHMSPPSADHDQRHPNSDHAEAAAANRQGTSTGHSTAHAEDERGPGSPLRQRLQKLQLAPSAELPVSTGPVAGSVRSDAEDALSTTLSDLGALTPSSHGEAALQESHARSAAQRSLHLHDLQQQIGDFSSSLAELVQAELGQSTADWQLLQRVNDIASSKYAAMAERLQGWMPLLEEARRKHSELAPLWQNIDAMAAQLDAIEQQVAELSRASIKLAKQVGV